MNSHMNSRWLLVMPNSSTGDLTLAAKESRDCSLPGFDFDGTTLRGGAGKMFLDLEPDRLVLRPIQFNFQVDEKLENYLEVLKKSLTGLRGTGESKFDCTIIPLDGLGKDFGLRFIFTNARVLSISDLDYDNNATNKYLSCNLSLRYENLQIKLGDEVIVDIEETK